MKRTAGSLWAPIAGLLALLAAAAGCGEETGDAFGGKQKTMKAQFLRGGPSEIRIALD